MAALKSTTVWESTDSSHAVVCIDSLTPLIQYTNPKRTYRFFHTLLNRLRSINALVHAHIDPDAHDTTALAMVESLFDATLAPTPDDAWECR